MWVLTSGLPGTVAGQSYSFRYLTVNDGLPSNETYSIYQGETGKLYIGTEFGLVHYDGEYFNPVPFEDHRFSGSMVFEIKKDITGKIWIRTYRDGFFYLENDTLRAFTGNATINKIIEESYIYQFYVDSSNSIWFTSGNVTDTIFRIDAEGKNLQQIPVKDDPEIEVQQFIYWINSSASLTVRSRIHNLSAPQPGAILEQKNGFGVIPPKEHLETHVSRSGLFVDHPHHFWLSMRNVMLHYHKDTRRMESYTLNDEIISVYEDKLGNILIGTRSAAYIYSVASGEIEILFDNRQVTGICQDSERGYWFTTNNGIVYMPSLEIFLIPGNQLGNTYISAIAGSDSLFATAGSDRYIRFFNTSGHHPEIYKLYDRQRNTHPKRILFNANKLLSEWHYVDLNSWEEVPLHPEPFGSILDAEATEHQMLLAFKRGFAVLNSDGDNPDRMSSKHTDLFCRAIYQDDDNIYIGTDRGVHIYNEKSGLRACFPGVLKFSVNDIHGTTSGEIIISTRAGGIFIIKEENIYQLSLEQGLSSPFCTRLLVENDSTFWVGTNHGLNRVQRSDTRSNHWQIDNWYAEDGLASDKINDLAKAGNFLFALTDEGINYFNPGNISTTPPSLNIDMIKASIKGRNAAVDSVIHLMPNERDIWFEFRVFGFKKRRNTQMMYTLSGNEQYLSQTGGQTILYRDLLPGEYLLEVKAISPAGKTIGKPVVYSILIEPHFYETLIFKIIVVIILLSLLAAAVINYLRRVENKRRRKWEFGNAQLEALNLQMNPHFLFNALNNIQYLSFSKDHKMLNRFVSGLSGLLRSILMLSKNHLIPLATELKNLEQYIELEVIRIEDETFSYEIIVDKELDLEKEFIPPMLLQPLVENAIWHGLLPRKGTKFLQISFTKSNRGFAIEVLDNGVGINQARESKINGHIAIKPSLGLDNIKRRLKLYESMGFGTAGIIIDDLESEKAGGSGTRVSMSFVLSDKNDSYDATQSDYNR